MKRFLFVLILVFLCINSFAYSKVEPQIKFGKVTEVVDGDTLYVDDEKIRLVGIDSPDRNEPQWEFIRDYVKNLILDKEVKVEICPIRPKDQYGRVRAIIYYKQGDKYLNLNTKLLREGYAEIIPEERCHIDTSLWIKYEKGMQAILNNPPATEEGSAAKTVGYIASISQKKFHRPNCINANKIDESDQTWFKTRDEALKQGYIPCKRCNP